MNTLDRQAIEAIDTLITAIADLRRQYETDSTFRLKGTIQEVLLDGMEQFDELHNHELEIEVLLEDDQLVDAITEWARLNGGTTPQEVYAYVLKTEPSELCVGFLDAFPIASAGKAQQILKAVYKVREFQLKFWTKHFAANI